MENTDQLQEAASEEQTVVGESTPEDTENTVDDQQSDETETAEYSADDIAKIAKDLEEREKSYKLLQAEFTRKSQRLAKLEKESSPESTPVEVNEPVKSERLQEILASKPELKESAWAIEQIQKASGLSYEDVIAKGGFSKSNKVSKAKSTDIMGNTSMVQKEKSVGEMNLEEYKVWRSKKGIGNGSTF